MFNETYISIVLIYLAFGFVTALIGSSPEDSTYDLDLIIALFFWPIHWVVYITIFLSDIIVWSFRRLLI